MVARMPEFPAWMRLWLIPIAVVLPSCNTTPPAEPVSGVVYETRTMERTLRDCPENLAPCASIALEYPAIMSAPTEASRARIEEYVRSILLAPIEEGISDSTAEGLMERFISSYREFADEFPESTGQWVMTRRIEVVYNAGDVFSLQRTEESYTGGAHPNASVTLASFDAQSGERIQLADLFVEGSDEALRAIAEEAFRKERALGPSDDFSEAGFWFEDGTFRLNENFAVVAQGLKFYFNPYEVGPYSMGPTAIVLGTDDLAALVRPDGLLSPR